jgi:hypothetical protein
LGGAGDEGNAGLISTLRKSHIALFDKAEQQMRILPTQAPSILGSFVVKILWI